MRYTSYPYCYQYNYTYTSGCNTHANSGYSNYNNSGCNTHSDSGCNTHFDLGYDNHVNTGCQTHSNSGCTTHFNYGCATHSNSGYSDHTNSGYSNHSNSWATNHTDSTYNDHGNYTVYMECGQHANYYYHSDYGYSCYDHTDYGCSDHTDTGCVDHTNSGCSTHSNSGCNTHSNSGYSDHYNSGYSDHYNSGHNDYSESGCNTHNDLGYDDHSNSGYDDHANTGCATHSNLGYSNHTNYAAYQDSNNKTKFCYEGDFIKRDVSVVTPTYTEYANFNTVSCQEDFNGEYTAYGNHANSGIVSTTPKWGRSLGISNPNVSRGVVAQENLADTIRNNMNSLNNKTKNPVSLSSSLDIGRGDELDETTLASFKNDIDNVYQKLKLAEPLSDTFDGSTLPNLPIPSENNTVQDDDVNAINSKVNELANENTYKDSFDCSDSSKFA